MSTVQQNVRSFWTDRSVLVTGCTGLLGSWLAEALVDAGAGVVGLERDRVPQSRLNRSSAIDKINLVRGEVEDYPLIERVLNEYQVQTVFHLAAQTIVGIANQNPLSTFETNIKGTWNVLEACRRTEWTAQIIIASSDKAYGEHAELPYVEDTPLMGRFPYDVSKTCADLLSQSYAKSYQLPVCITRLGNLYGGGDLNFNRLFPGTIRSAVYGEAPVVRSDGKFSRDYIYVEDAAIAYMMLAEKMADDPRLHGQAFNFSYETPLTGLAAVDKILQQVGRTDLVPQILGIANNEIPHQHLSARKARTTLGWEPRFEFDEGLSRTVAWYQNWLAD